MEKPTFLAQVISPQHNPPVAHTGDVLVTSTVLASMAGVLPTIAALLGVIWYLIQIKESATFQAWWSDVKSKFRK